MFPACLFLLSLFQVTGAPQLLWKKASGAQEDAGGDTEGRAHPSSAPAVVGRVPGTVIWCTKRNKNHIARDFHSFTAQQMTRSPHYVSTVGYFLVVFVTPLFLQLSDTGCCYGVKGTNIGELRRILCSSLSVDFKKLTCGISLTRVKLSSLRRA